MLAYLAVYCGITYLFTLAMDYQQTRTNVGLPSGKTAGSDSDVCSILAVSAVCIQAFVCLIALKGTIWFPAAALFFAFTLSDSQLSKRFPSAFAVPPQKVAPAK